MSERGSFTTQYIYSWEDYQTIRNVLDQGDKYLCVSPPITWDGHVMPIVCGKVGEMSMNSEWMTVSNALYRVKTKSEIKVVVMCEAGSIILIKKKPNGEIDSVVLGEKE